MPPTRQEPEPGARASVYIETHGCAFNQADSEALAGVLQAAGYALVDSPRHADVAILNTCTVKDRAYDRFRGKFEAMRREELAGRGPRLIVAGCIPKAAPDAAWLAGVAALGPDQIKQAAQAVEEALRGVASHRLGQPVAEEALERPLLPARRERSNVEIIPLAAGCLSVCSFCQTRLARGRLTSFRPGDIVRRAEMAAGEGVDEIWLTAQDAAAYGRDIDYPLPRLIDRLCAIPGDFRIRLGMSSPCWIYQRLDEYLALFENPKLFTFLHVPLQSGSDRVLRAMKRGNTAAQFLEIAERFGGRFPQGALLTDVIAGFPGEEEADFAATLGVLRAARPAGVNRSNFSARPGTEAARLTPLPVAAVKERMALLTDETEKLCRAWHEAWIGRRERVRVFERKGQFTVAHSQAGRPALLAEPLPAGEWREIVYSGAAAYHHLVKLV